MTVTKHRLRIWLGSIATLCSLSTSSAFATCGNDQQIRFETDIKFCMEYNGDRRDLIAAREGMIRNVKANSSQNVLSSFNDCQKGQPNGGDNYSNGSDCEREHSGLALRLAKRYCHGRC
jgi:hypothetical protein